MYVIGNVIMSGYKIIIATYFQGDDFRMFQPKVIEWFESGMPSKGKDGIYFNFLAGVFNAALSGKTETAFSGVRFQQI